MSTRKNLRNKRLWTEDEDNILRELATGALTNAEIGKELGRSKCAVTARLHLLQVKRPVDVLGKVRSRARTDKQRGNALRWWSPQSASPHRSAEHNEAAERRAAQNRVRKHEAQASAQRMAGIGLRYNPQERSK